MGLLGAFPFLVDGNKNERFHAFYLAYEKRTCLGMYSVHFRCYKTQSFVIAMHFAKACNESTWSFLRHLHMTTQMHSALFEEISQKRRNVDNIVFSLTNES